MMANVSGVQQIVSFNSSGGWVVELVEAEKERCHSWLLLPAENLWPVGLRAFLYIFAMFYVFLGIAIASDIFMSAIEVITSRKKTIVLWDAEKQQRVEREVLVWNETVANLTLMALGSSAPEILLAVLETVQTLDVEEDKEGLGTFTIIGSAAFNLLVITAICIISVPSPESKRIKELGVFAMTSVWSIYAYIWMMLVVLVITPGVISPWEAWLTFLYLPILVLMAWATDCGWWVHKCRPKSATVDAASSMNVRVLTNDRKHSIVNIPSRELGALEKEREKTMLRSRINLGSESQTNLHNDMLTHNRFRHAAVRNMMGGHKRKVQVPILPTSVSPRGSRAPTAMGMQRHFKMPTEEELLGKFTFGSPTYSVLESKGIIEIDVLYHRKMPPKSTKLAMVNGNSNANGSSTNETSFTGKEGAYMGVVSVDYETREGSGKDGKDFVYTSGTLTFQENETSKSVAITIINDNQYLADKDFYVFLKNPRGESAGIGDPSVATVTIIDDDEPGEFQFSEAHYYSDLKAGCVSLTVIRQKGCDGVVTIEYSTVDGTARGGETPGEGCDFKATAGIVTFKHGETTKQIDIEVNREAKGSKNFIITLRNPSLGAKIGENSATVANITKDNLADRIAGILDEFDEEITWGDQFKNAMVIEADVDEDGEEIPLTWLEYLLHFLTFGWKVICAFIPPKKYLGAVPMFIGSLAVIGFMTALVEALASLLSCVIGLDKAIAGITIIALGTSLPDTFASRTAALHDSHADAAIGNITGSNSVNVFLGLGVPWVIKSMYLWSKDKVYRVNGDALVPSVVIFSIIGSMCIVMLYVRRKWAGGELGGKKSVKIASGAFLISLWLLYITLSTIKAYYPQLLPW